MIETLTIKALGGLQMWLGETAVSGFVSRKAEALLVYLVCNPRMHARETLATMLWDDLPQQRSLANLSVLLNSLRKQLAPFLQSSRFEIGINPESNIVVDAAIMTEALAELSFRSELTRSTAVYIAQAVAQYKGAFMAGFFVKQASDYSEWVMLEQERLQQLAIRGMTQLVEFYLQRQQFGDGIALGQRLINLDPLREESHRQLMRLFALSGQRPAAMEQYQTCVTVLAEELGVEPVTETTVLYTQIVAGTFEKHGAENASLPRPDIESALPFRMHHNLPAETTSFVGRERELAHIQKQLNSFSCRLLTIVGPGGVGKTRLALAAARQQVHQYLDGVWFVQLASLLSTDFLETAVADALGFSFSGVDDPHTQLLNFLRQKEMLLVLDNFEHLLTEKGIGFVTEVLAHAPECQIIISSRERLNLQAEWLLEVEGLPFPNSVQAQNMQQYGAINLFQQRVQQVLPEYQLNGNNLNRVVEIVVLLAGMPLGIELAAANLRYMELKEIIAGIRISIDFLQTNQRDMPVRHRNLRAVIDRSWQMLNEAEQAAFMALSVFRGQFSQQAALAVLKTDPSVLYGLVDKSMLQRNENGRLQMHNILRQFAAEKLAELPENSISVRGRHGTFYANLLQQWQLPIIGGQQIEALEAIQADIENIRVSWQYAQTLDRQTPSLIPLLDNALEALFHFYNMRSAFREGATLLKQAVIWLSPPANEAERFLQARIQTRYGWFAFLLGEREAGEAALRESLSTLQMANGAKDIIFCHNHLGAIAYYQHEFTQAQTHLQQALSAARAVADAHGEAIGLNIMGVLHIDLADFEQAERYLRQSLTLKRQLGDQWGVAFSLEMLGRVEMAFAQLNEAKARLQESMEIRRQLGDQRGVALCLQQLGDLAKQRDDGKTAVSLYRECLSIFEEIGDAQAIAAVREKLMHDET